MAVETRWLIEDRVLYQRIHGDVTLEDLDTAAKNVDIFVEHLSNTLVYLVVDERDVTKFPISLREVSNAMQRKPSPLLAWTLILASDGMHRFLSSAVGQLLGLRIRAFNRPEEVIAFLADQDETLADLKLPTPTNEQG